MRALQALLWFIYHFELLELVQWMYRVDNDYLTVYETSKISTLSVGFCIAASAFKTLSGYLDQLVTRTALTICYGK